MPDVISRPVELTPDTDLVPQTGEPISSHIVANKPGEDAATKVMEARIYGTPLEALCGHVWIPSRDPKQHPICEKCKEIYEVFRMFDDEVGNLSE
jgi:hypothetical protein